jgi:hypothetical protein
MSVLPKWALEAGARKGILLPRGSGPSQEVHRIQL